MFTMEHKQSKPTAEQCHHHRTKFHSNPPTGSKVAPTSEVETSGIFEWLKLRN
jgi:hypothetical protein